MHTDRFDTLARTLSTAGSRRRALFATLGGASGLLGVSTLQEADAKNCKRIDNKKKRKKCLARARRTECIPACDGKQCGANGCGGTCGSCGTGAVCEANQCVTKLAVGDPCDEAQPGECISGKCGCTGGSCTCRK